MSLFPIFCVFVKNLIATTTFPGKWGTDSHARAWIGAITVSDEFYKLPASRCVMLSSCIYILIKIKVSRGMGTNPGEKAGRVFLL